jgi:Uma2 family endonuclease
LPVASRVLRTPACRSTLMENMLPGRASSILQPIRPLKRVEYEKLVFDGFFRDEHVELIFGMVVAMAPIDPAHCESVLRIDELLKKALERRARVFTQSPFAATEDSEPQPDVMVVPDASYWTAHPQVAFLVVEVARSSLRHDRGVKADLYGVSDVREYWIVDHVHGVVEVYRDRVDGHWRSLHTYGRGESIAPVEFPDVQIAVDDIMPPHEFIGEEPSDGKKRD